MKRRNDAKNVRFTQPSVPGDEDVWVPDFIQNRGESFDPVEVEAYFDELDELVLVLSGQRVARARA